jgi:hypothetical protein
MFMSKKPKDLRNIYFHTYKCETVMRYSETAALERTQGFRNMSSGMTNLTQPRVN